jgi:hypothetical protein
MEACAGPNHPPTPAAPQPYADALQQAGSIAQAAAHEEAATEIVKVEEYDGTYQCVICSESVRGTPALQCSQCNSNPVHVACVAGSHFKDTCSQCACKTMGPSSWCVRAVGDSPIFRESPLLAQVEALDCTTHAVLEAREAGPPVSTQNYETCRELGNLRPDIQEKVSKRVKKRQQESAEAKVLRQVAAKTDNALSERLYSWNMLSPVLARLNVSLPADDKTLIIAGDQEVCTLLCVVPCPPAPPPYSPALIFSSGTTSRVHSVYI